MHRAILESPSADMILFVALVSHVSSSLVATEEFQNECVSASVNQGALSLLSVPSIV